VDLRHPAVEPGDVPVGMCSTGHRTGRSGAPCPTWTGTWRSSAAHPHGGGRATPSSHQRSSTGPGRPGRRRRRRPPGRGSPGILRP